MYKGGRRGGGKEHLIINPNPSNSIYAKISILFSEANNMFSSYIHFRLRP